MSIDLSRYFDADYPLRGEDELQTLFEDQEHARRIVVFKVAHDLAVFGKNEGYTQNQTRGAIETLFSTFAAEWSLYILIGSDALSTAIANDVSIAWLDTVVGGKTVRTRIIERLV